MGIHHGLTGPCPWGTGEGPSNTLLPYTSLVRARAARRGQGEVQSSIMEPEPQGPDTRPIRTSKGKSRVLFRLTDDEREDLAEIAQSSPSPHERREAEEALKEDEIARAEEEAAAKNTPGRLALARRRASSTPDAPNAPGHASPENNPSGTDAPQAPLALIATPDAGASSSNQGAQVIPDIWEAYRWAGQNATIRVQHDGASPHTGEDVEQRIFDWAAENKPAWAPIVDIVEDFQGRGGVQTPVLTPVTETTV